MDITATNNDVVTKEEADLTKVLNKLSVEATKSVDAYINNSEKVNKITDEILKVLSNEQEIMNMEHEELMKLLTISTNLQTKPLEQFTKLFVQMNQFQDKLNIGKEIDDLRRLKEEFNKANEEAEGNIIEVELTEEAIESHGLLKGIINNS